MGDLHWTEWWCPLVPCRCAVCRAIVWPWSRTSCETTIGWCCDWDCFDRVASFGEPQIDEADDE